MFSTQFTTALVAALALITAVSAGQRGLAYIPKNHPTDDALWAEPGSPISWYYNWGSVNVGEYNGKLEFVPMMWGQDQASTFPQQVQSLKTNGVKVQNLLAFNEPDGASGGGSGISPSQAASLYKQYYQPLGKQGFRLGGPATTGSPQGLTWYSQFMSACSGCQIDFIPIHWYGNLDGLKWYLGAVQQAYPNTKLWVTEFADTNANSEQDAETFTTAALALFDSNPMIERYSIFPACRESDSSIPYAGLLDNSGDLSPVGAIYMKGAAAGSTTPSASNSTAIPSGSSGSKSVSVSYGGVASPSPVSSPLSSPGSGSGSVSVAFAGVASPSPVSSPAAGSYSAVAAAASGGPATVVVADARGPATVTVTVDSCKSSTPAVVAADVQETSTSSPAEGSSTPEHENQGGCGAPHKTHDHSHASATPTPNHARLAKRHIVAARRGKHHF